MNWRNLRRINHSNNEIVLLPQLARFINRLINGEINVLNVYNDTQNIHDSSVQLSVKESVEKLSTRNDIYKFDREILIEKIINDNILLNKEQLIEYTNDESIHSLLLLNYAEILWYVLQTIEKDFNKDTQKEIKLILNKEIEDSECKCFTGRINRTVNCLNGFSELVKIKIHDSSQIGNIIYLVKERLGTEYTPEQHKIEVRKELQERNYSENVIDEWIEYIE